MIIVYLSGGLGNQLFQYAAGKRLAHKWNTELKIDLGFYDAYKLRSYVLNSFNVKETFATEDEIKRLAELVPNNSFGIERGTQFFFPEILDCPDNVWLRGCWESERYFADISDIVREEFTLRNPLSAAARRLKEKILGAECSVSLHFRHGDFAYNPERAGGSLFAIIPLDYYYECLNRLKQVYKNLSLFIFANNPQWIKQNFHTNMPTEFVADWKLTDAEEIHLMSLCQHNIIANSTFSWWGAWLNQNPDKKVFVPIPAPFLRAGQMYRHFLAERNENSPLQSDRWIRIPFDLNRQPNIKMRPYFSLLLVVNNDVATIRETLESIIGQDYKFYEVIIIDNASTDGSGEICRQLAKVNDKVKLVNLYSEVQNGAAWNKALELAQGQFVLFLKGGDKIFPDALSSLYLTNEWLLADFVCSVSWLQEDERGNIELAGKKFSTKEEPSLKGLDKVLRKKFDKPNILKILASNKNTALIATKVFKRKFLENNAIRFNEKIGDDAELLFTVEAMFQAEEMLFEPTPFYVAPQKNS